MVTNGAAASYYGDGQTQVQDPPEVSQQQDQSKYQHAAPSYSHDIQNNNNEDLPYGDEKPTFAQAFKIEKPRYNDLWAGILVCFGRVFPSRHVDEKVLSDNFRDLLAHLHISGLCSSLWALTSKLFVK